MSAEMLSDAVMVASSILAARTADQTEARSMKLATALAQLSGSRTTIVVRARRSRPPCPRLASVVAWCTTQPLMSVVRNLISRKTCVVKRADDVSPKHESMLRIWCRGCLISNYAPETRVTPPALHARPYDALLSVSATCKQCALVVHVLL